MPYYADLHIHSKYSRATSKDCDLEHLSYWARRKGIAVVGTGDFTHPAWRQELRDKLIPAEPGLFRLRPEIEAQVAAMPGDVPGPPTRFLLSVEISSIYKRLDKTRKVHNLVYAASFDTVERLVARLEKVGNLGSDGRPILGLDSRDLLEMTLESGSDAYLVPAHIWTPWFSMLGSKSGFDEVLECFGDLSEHIFAVETGLSSDPAMNWRLSMLDGLRLLSNSDAHSPAKLGREANLLHTDLDYFALRRALETGDGFGGTVEFFPEEGKYHLDGHRKCGVRLDPCETKSLGGRCPVCKKPLTVGVMARVDELADRHEHEVPTDREPFSSLVPLPELLAEIEDCGPSSKRVAQRYEHVLGKLGPEFDILTEVPVEDIRRAASELLAEAVRRVRAGEVIREAGYDGEYGVIRAFRKDELMPTRSLFAMLGDKLDPLAERPDQPVPRELSHPLTDDESVPGDDKRDADPSPSKSPADASLSPTLAALDADQCRAAQIVTGPLLIVAGPGTGKTRTITHRLASLILDHDVAPHNLLAITFTRRAAAEMQERLESLLGDTAHEITVATFHGLAHQIVRAHAIEAGLEPGFAVASPAKQAAIVSEVLGISLKQARRELDQLSQLRRTRQRPEPGSEAEQLAALVARHLRAQNLVDFDELVERALVLLDDDKRQASYRARFRYVCVDEYQDVDEQQYRLIQQLCPADGNLCCIGDPDQAIYRFRGADVRFFLAFQQDFVGAQTVTLERNYRSGRCIVDGALQAIAPSTLVPTRRLEPQSAEQDRIVIHRARSDAAEAEFVVHTIEQLIGGYSFFSVDSGRVESGDASPFGFADFAVLYRTRAQLPALQQALDRSGIPVQGRHHGPLAQHPQVPAALEHVAQHGGPLDEVLAAWAETDPGTIGIVELLRPLARVCGDDRARFADEIMLADEIDTWDPRADRVSLLTLHAAKGLEFPVVFVVGCEDNIMPLRYGDTCDDAEERRLFFVGMTRAKRRLFLTSAAKRQWRGGTVSFEDSPFLRAIEVALTERPEPRASTRPRERQMTLF